MKPVYDKNGKKLLSFNMKLWTINKFLRFTGFRAFVGVDWDGDELTIIGIQWYGFGWLGREDWNGEEVENNHH